MRTQRKTAAWRRSVAVVIVVFAAFPTLTWAEEHQLYLLVRNQYGQPIDDLQPGEVIIEHQGTACDVRRLEAGTSPMTVALMVDDSDSAASSINSLREGLAAFLRTLPIEHEVGLFTLSGQPTEVVGFTTDRARLSEQAQSLFVERGTGVVLLDGLVETWERRFDDGTAWPVFVAIVHGGAEASRRVRERQLNEFVGVLRARGATVHALLVSSRPGTVQVDASIFMTENTGGRYRALAAATALPTALTELARTMADHYEAVQPRYRVVFECDEDNPRRIRAGVTRPAVAVQTFADRFLEPAP